MMKLAILSLVFAAALAAPSAEPTAGSGKKAPALDAPSKEWISRPEAEAPESPEPGARSERETPASTAKLTPIVPPIISPIAHIPYVPAPIVPQVSPYAYTYSAPLAPVAYVPGSYSIEQHGYNIAY